MSKENVEEDHAGESSNMPALLFWCECLKCESLIRTTFWTGLRGVIPNSVRNLLYRNLLLCHAVPLNVQKESDGEIRAYASTDWRSAPSIMAASRDETRTERAPSGSDVEERREDAEA